VVKNLGLENIDITSRCLGGALSASMNAGTVSNVYVTGDLTMLSPSSCCAGGLIGCQYGGTISSAYSTVDVDGGPGSSGNLIGMSSGGSVTNVFTDGGITGSAEYGAIGGNYTLWCLLEQHIIKPKQLLRLR